MGSPGHHPPQAFGFALQEGIDSLGMLPTTAPLWASGQGYLGKIVGPMYRDQQVSDAQNPWDFF